MRRRFIILLVAFNTVAILLATAGYTLLHHSNNPVEMRDLQQPLSARVTSNSTPTDSRGTSQRWLSFVSLGTCAHCEKTRTGLAGLLIIPLFFYNREGLPSVLDHKSPSSSRTIGQDKAPQIASPHNQGKIIRTISIYRRHIMRKTAQWNRVQALGGHLPAQPQKSHAAS